MMRTLLLIVLTFSMGLNLFAQSPANDSCSNAISVGLEEVVDFTTVESTTDGPAGAQHENCFATANDSIPNDVWYSFTPDISGEVRWTNCGTADYDSRMAVYGPGASCPPTDEDIIACNDDGTDCANSTSELTFVISSGATYLLRMGGYAGEDGVISEGSGTFVINELDGGPVNNFCANAIPVFLGLDQDFSTADATTDGPDHPDNPCFGFNSLSADNDIWYTFTPDYTGFAEWATCNTINFDSRLAVYNPGSACPPLDEDLYSCNDDGADCENYSSLVVFPVEEGETYLLRLGGYSGESGLGTFDLQSIIPADPPPNDLCTASEEVNIITPEVADDFEGTIPGTTTSASVDPDNFIFPSCVGNPQGEAADVWYQVNTLGNDSLELRFYITDENSLTAFYLDVFETCESVVDETVIMGSCIYIDPTVGTATTVITGLPSGEDVTLYIRVTTHVTFDATGDFEFQVVGDIVIGTNDLTFANELSFSPNPVSEKGFLEFQLAEDTQVGIEIFNLLGQSMSGSNQGKLTGGNHRIPIELSDLNPGIYLLQINNGSQKQNLKIVVQ
jgi:hypothetical protein